MLKKNTHFLFLLLKYIPAAIRLLINNYWKKIFDTENVDNQKNQAEVIGFILRQKGVQITDKKLHALLGIIPNHISTDATERVPYLLDEWDIQASSEILESTDDNSKPYINVKSLTFPCLIRLDNGEPAALLALSETNNIIFYHPNQGIKLTSIESLLKYWSGFFFKLDVSKAFQQVEYTKEINKQYWSNWHLPLTVLFGILISINSVSDQLTTKSGTELLLWIIINVCLLAGCIFSFILSQHSIGNTGGLFATLCSRNTNNACSDILDSPQAKFYGIPHADIGIAYFSGSLLLLNSTTNIPWMINSLSLLTLIYSAYSLYVQKFILNQWCRLCLATQAAIVVQAITIILYSKELNFLPTENNLSILLSLIIFIFPGLLWSYIKPGIITEINKKELENQLTDNVLNNDNIQAIQQKRIERSINVLNSDETAVTEDELLEGDIVIGSTGEQQIFRVVIGLSPSCPHCGVFLEELYQFANSGKWPIELRIRLILSKGNEQEAINDRTVAEHVTALVISDGSIIAIKALRSWYQTYQSKNLKNWLQSIRKISNDEINDVSVLLADTSYWVNHNDINVMPAFFVEGKYIPNVSAEYSTILLRKICLA